MNYAVIRSGGKQYKVSAGDVLELDRLNLNGKKLVDFDDVLLLVNEGKISVGKPNVPGAKVSASLIGDKKGDKIRVMKYKAKVRYRKTIGFRAALSVVKIEKISSGAGKTDRKTETSVKTAPKRAKTKLT